MRCLRFQGDFSREVAILQQISGLNCVWQNFTLRSTPGAFAYSVALFLGSAARPQVREIILP